jgi:hypothetical protein
VESTVAWQDIELTTDPTTLNALNDCVPNSNVGYVRDAICDDLTIDRISGSFNESNRDNRQRFTVKTQATVYGGRFWGADHRFKLGFNVENERYFRELRRDPSITYDEEFPFGGLPFGIVLAEVDVPREDRVQATSTNWAVYAEDQLKPASNVTITVGARVDREELSSQGKRAIDAMGELDRYEADLDYSLWPSFQFIGDWRSTFTGYEQFEAFRLQLSVILCSEIPPHLIPNCIANTSPSIPSQNQLDLHNRRLGTGLDVQNTNVSPFLSVSWDPWSDGKTAIKVAAGRHYNNIPLVIPLQELEPVRSSVEYRVELDTRQTEIFGGISPNLTVRTVDPNLRTPYQDELTLSFERELWAETSLKLTYIDRKFRDQIQDQDINVAIGDYGRCASQLYQQFAAEEDLPTSVIPAPGTGFVYQDPWTLDVYTDREEGIGDGRVDDCGGNTFFFEGSDIFGSDSYRIQSADGLADLYVQNPFWSSILEIGNLNRIDYEAFVLELVRRQYRSWEMNASYTYSKAEGDGEDFFQELGNDPSLRGSTQGFQSYDQRHVVKLNATTITPWGVRLGTAVTWQSGLPYSIIEEDTSDDILPPTTSLFANRASRLRQIYPTGVRNDQRNTSYWNVDVKATKELRFRKLDVQLSAEMFNALNDDTYIIYNPFFETGQRLNGVNEAQRRFGRRWQLGVKFAY